MNATGPTLDIRSAAHRNEHFVRIDGAQASRAISVSTIKPILPFTPLVREQRDRPLSTNSPVFRDPPLNDQTNGCRIFTRL